MTREFKLPDLGEGIHEGEIVDILVDVDDEVDEDQPIIEVETDKATVEITSPYQGTVTDIRVGRGDLVEVGDVVLVFGNGEESVDEGAESEGSDSVKAEEERQTKAPPAEAKSEPDADKPDTEETDTVSKPAESAKRPDLPVPASPATRRLARELDVDLHEVAGSGPGGRVTSDDVRAFAEGETEREKTESEADEPAESEAKKEERQDSHGAPTSVEEISPVRPSAIALPDLPDFGHWGPVEREPLRSVRRSTAKQMALAWSQIPHVSHHDVADITELECFRQAHKEEIAEQGGSLTHTVFVMKATVTALKAHPRFNASLDADAEEIILKKYYHLGVAVDTHRGLLVPVIRDVDRKSIAELAVELKELVVQTHDDEIDLDDLQGGTMTITNPGPLGGTAFTPIVNYPQVAILGMARASWQPAVRGQGEDAQLVSRYLLPLVVAFDHRVVDGADAARFMNVIVDILENPDKLLLHT